jgi:formate dehydrogenase subunit delta
MDVARLVAMANDIAAFFDSESADGAAAESVRLHLQKFWEPRMRREIIAHVEKGGAGLCATARAAVEKLGSAGGASEPHSAAL